MKYLILILLSLSLVGLISNSYAATGDFITSFDGSVGIGGTPFILPFGVAVDSNDRIIVSDFLPSHVRIYDSTGVFITSFDGSDGLDGTSFGNPFDVAVDSNDRIIVSDINKQIVQIFSSSGVFSFSIDGIGDDPFVNLRGIAVDSGDRIIVSDVGANLVHIFGSTGDFISSFASTGEFGITVDSGDRIITADTDKVHIFSSSGVLITSFDGNADDGSTPFRSLYGIAVDDNDRIIVVDVIENNVQIFDSTGVFLTSLDGITPGIDFWLVAGIEVDSNNRIIITDVGAQRVHIFEGYPIADVATAEEADKNGSGCSGDCTPPTIGLDLDTKRIVDNGFSYNNNPVDVIAWHTPYPLITAIVNQTNTVEITVYENQGIFNLAMVQFGLGLEVLGQPLHDVEVLIEVHLEALFSENTVIVDKVVIRDRDNLIDTFSVFAVTEPVQCIDDEIDEECLKITLEYSYREATINNMMVVNVMDIARNTQNFYFNDGVEVIGDSLNEPPTYKLSNKKLKQQTENLWLTLTRTDKVNHIWMDEFGVEYLQISNDRFDRITPQESYKCTDPPLDQVNVPTRNNCHFRDQTVLWTYN